MLDSARLPAQQEFKAAKTKHSGQVNNDDQNSNISNFGDGDYRPPKTFEVLIVTSMVANSSVPD